MEVDTGIMSMKKFIGTTQRRGEECEISEQGDHIVWEKEVSGL